MTPPDPKALRDAFGSFMTGVTVVTTRTADGTPVGFTANSFSSVSLDPPLLLVCPGKFLSSYDAFAECSQFAVSILAEGQEEVANTFASFKGDRFARVLHRSDSMGNILIDGALAQFACKTHRRIDAGDHAVLIGQVLAFSHRAGRGLGYAGGRFFSLGLERAALDHPAGKGVAGAIITDGDTVYLERSASGYCPPGVVVDDRHELLRTLARRLERRGLPVKLGPAYSVFDDGKSQCAYFLATKTADVAGAFEAHPIRDIPRLTFASASIGEMMNRFAIESQTRSFGLYIGDAQRGDVHYLPEGT